jgi:hypothetical protein
MSMDDSDLRRALYIGAGFSILVSGMLANQDIPRI